MHDFSFTYFDDIIIVYLSTIAKHPFCYWNSPESVCMHAILKLTNVVQYILLATELILNIV